jgi:ABC-type nitrate/sulfonate/bicarbonate transport system permease component
MKSPPTTSRLAGQLRSVLASLPPARGLLPLLLLLLLWQLLQPGPSPYFPGPAQWWKATASLFDRERLLAAFGATTVSFLEGLALAIVLGTALGVLVGISRRTDRALQPLLEFMRAIPPPVTVPIATLLIGYSESMKLTVVVLSGLWPILLNAVRQIDPLLLEVARSFRLTAWQRMQRVVLPAIVPSLLIGIRIAIPLAIVVTLLVEMLTSLPGVGALMIKSQRNYQSSEVYALLVLVGLFGFVVNDLFAVIEGVIMRRWPPRA